jgi:hypothetical protein
MASFILTNQTGGLVGTVTLDSAERIILVDNVPYVGSGAEGVYQEAAFTAAHLDPTTVVAPSTSSQATKKPVVDPVAKLDPVAIDPVAKPVV